MKLLLFTILALSACGQNTAPKMDAATTCRIDGLTVELEAGVKVSCETHLMILGNYRDEYAGRWGVAPAITVRIRNTDDLRTTGPNETFSVQGHTYDDNVIDLTRVGWQSLPHELNHIVHGSGHAGWCSPFEPWQRTVIGLDEREYLGCAP